MHYEVGIGVLGWRRAGLCRQ